MNLHKTPSHQSFSQKSCLVFPKKKFRNPSTYDCKWHKIHDFFGKNVMIRGFQIFAMRASFVISRIFLTSLRFFVEKKYLRSRRAPRACTKTPKVQKLAIYDWNWHKTLKIWGKIIILWFSHFCYESFIGDLEEKFNNSRIVCRGKISEIPQSTSCLYQNTKSPKHLIYV